MDDKLYRAFTGSEIEVILLQGELEDNGIACFTRDGVTAGWKPGFYFGNPESVDLFISLADKEKAGTIIQEFINNREAEKQG